MTGRTNAEDFTVTLTPKQRETEKERAARERGLVTIREYDVKAKSARRVCGSSHILLITK